MLIIVFKVVLVDIISVYFWSNIITLSYSFIRNTFLNSLNIINVSDIYNIDQYIYYSMNVEKLSDQSEYIVYTTNTTVY
jgi:hypothetical protein